MKTFRSHDGFEIAYYVDDFTDPWTTPDTILLLHALPVDGHAAVHRDEVGLHGGVVLKQEGDHVLFLCGVHIAIGIGPNGSHQSWRSCLWVISKR